jgi:hypothetical protein
MVRVGYGQVQLAQGIDLGLVLPLNPVMVNVQRQSNRIVVEQVAHIGDIVTGRIPKGCEGEAQLMDPNPP